MSLCTRVLLAAALTLSSPAVGWAQPIELDPNPAPPLVPTPVPPPVVLPAPVACPMGAMNEKGCMQPFLETNHQYLVARSRRNTGIVLTSVGSGVGLIAMVGAWASYMGRSAGCLWSCNNSYTGERAVAGVGGGLFIVSLAVGIPLIVSGSREMRFVRSQYLNLVPVPTVDLGSRHASFGATLRF